MSELRFVVAERKELIPTSPGPYFVLLKDNWDDFGHKVQFQFSFVDAIGERIRLGAVKILQRTSDDSRSIEVATQTRLPTEFSELPPEYISIGQDDEYYQFLHSLSTVDAPAVLRALRDIAWSPAFASEFEPTSAFRNALMRENGARRARRFGRALARGEPIYEKPAFTYLGQIPGADSDIEVRFRFDPFDEVPGRIVGLIGRNAVGKTRFLASLATDLAQTTRSSAGALREQEMRFPGGRPLFTRVIAVSFSAFDRFKQPKADHSSSYVYCGIRSAKGGSLSRPALVETYGNNMGRIRRLDRKTAWATYMHEILGDLGKSLTETPATDEFQSEVDAAALEPLSSGQAILAHFVTGLMAWIQPNSLVLFDEPETHLHPNAVANLVLALSHILTEFDSYAVVATHSPVVIQEIPAKRVLLFNRTGNDTVAEPLGLESFGESVTELTRHVFETIEVTSVYRDTLRRLAMQESPAEVAARFEHGLSLNAQAYLLAQYGKKAGGKN